ncbi:protein arginine kinase [uncultured Clostridium sp.]|uniref:protein arginine kinase n=1 Tax=uncultured Clostridium sp. TaxID=59620 RepID=UPI0028ECF104|nr:protein arginine kinase [uncultured Clostridium sp.]
MKNWMISPEDNKEIVISSRIRLARNIKNISFPHRLKEEEGRDLVNTIEEAFYSFCDTKQDYSTYYLWQSDPLSNNIYLDKHLISSKLLSNYMKAAFIINRDETVSIMINEEDHLRIQCITSGLNLEEAYDAANKIDDLLEEKLEYAYSEQLGYMTACPTNIGTGLRASVMIHLPALSMSNEMNGVLNALTQVGMTIRGLYGEGSKSIGNIYQISNQITLGVSEKEILDNLKAVVNHIINQENIAREKFIKTYEYELKDRVYRAYGILKSAVIMDSSECLSLLSSIRFGIEMGIINDMDKNILNELMVDTQRAMLQKTYNRELSDRESDIYRAELLRKKLNKQ